MKKQLIILIIFIGTVFFGISQNLIQQDTITICNQSSYTLIAPSPTAFNVWKKNGEEEVVISSSMTFKSSGWYHLYSSTLGINDVSVCQLFNNANSYTAPLNVPSGHQITSLQIALWGTPNTNCTNPTAGSCNLNVTSIINRSFLGKNNFSYYAGQFPDPCTGTQKYLYTKYICSPYIHDSVYINILPSINYVGIQDLYACSNDLQTVTLPALQCDTTYELIQTLVQPVNNTTQSTLSLEMGQLYRLKITNTVSFGGGAQNYDAAYFFPTTATPNIFWRFNGYQPGPLNQFRPVPDGYANNHTYYFYFLSDGTPQNIGAYDCCLGDNAGSLTIYVEKVIVNPGCGLNYSVSGVPVTGTNISLPPSNQFYTVELNNGSASCIIDTFFINPPTLSPLDLGSDTIVVCSTQASLDATSNAAINYFWSTGETSPSIEVNSSGQYTVEVSDNYGCAARDTIFVQLSAFTVSAGPDQSVCEETQVTLSGIGGTTYNWDNGVQNGVAFVPTGNQVYTVTSTSSSGCVATDEVVVTVYPLPNVSAGVDQSVCDGAQITLSGSGALNYIWNNGVSNGIPFTEQGTQIYTVTGIDPNNCSNTDQVTITVNALPSVSAGADQIVCDGAQITLSGSGASSYTWDNGVSNGMPFTEQGTQTYTVTGTNANNCSNTDQVMVTVNPLPTVSGGDDQTICEGEAITLSGSGAVSYSWDNGITNGQPFVPQGTLSYTVVGTDGNGCVNTDAVLVTVNLLPNVSGVADQSIFLSTSTLAQFTVASGANSYQWQTNLGLGFQNLSDAGQYSGTTTNTLNVSNVTIANHNQQFRCLVADGSCADTTAVAVLSVVDDLGITHLQNNGSKKLIKITDLNGKETPFRKNTVLIFLYEDGTVERVFEAE